MNLPVPTTDILKLADAEGVLADVARQLKTGTIVPFLGPAVAEAGSPAFPVTPEALSAFFGTKVALPKRAKGNAWTSAQHIEGLKHRNTVTALMNEAFAPTIAPTPLHTYLASLKLPMIVDTSTDERMLGTYTGMYYIASQFAAILGPAITGLVVDLSGGDFRTIFVVVPAFFGLAIVSMLFVRRGESKRVDAAGRAIE